MDIHPWSEVVEALPPLSVEERDGLRESIVEHGVQYPVLVLPDGRIIDGYHRWELSEETAPTKVIDMPETVAFILALSLNADRRQLTPQTAAQKREEMQARRAAAGQLREQGMTQQAVAEQLGVGQQRISDWEQGATITGTGNSCPPPDKRQKIPSADYASILARVEAGESQTAIAREYGVTKHAITQLRKREGKQHDREAQGLPPKGKSGPPRRFTEAEEDAIEARYRGGAAVETLAYDCATSKSTIQLTIKRVRARREQQGTPATPTTGATDGTAPATPIDFAAKAEGRKRQTPAPPKPVVEAEIIREQAVKWWTEAKRWRDEWRDLESRFGDQLPAALAGSVEGEVVGNGLQEMAAAYAAAAEAIRCGHTGQEDHRRTVDRQRAWVTRARH